MSLTVLGLAIFVLLAAAVIVAAVLAMGSGDRRE